MRLMKMLEMRKKILYLDYQATTPIDPNISKILLEEMQNFFANPSANNFYGWQAKAIIDLASDNIAKLLSIKSEEIIYTSSATEANNLALRGFCKSYVKKANKKPHVITVVTEHSSVLQPLKVLEQENIAEVTYLKVNNTGLIDLGEFRNAIKNNTSLASIMMVNNEIGVVQPMKEIGKICLEKSIILHSDIVQAFGKIPINVSECNVNMATFSAHKHYGPRGVAGLYVNEGVELEPIIYGGGQQNGLHPGTMSAPLISALGNVAKQSVDTMNNDRDNIKKIFDCAHNQVREVDFLQINGNIKQRWPGNLNITIKGIMPNVIKYKLKNFSYSSGAACSSGQDSHVLKAIGLSKQDISRTIRVGIGRYTELNDIELFFKILKNIHND